MQPPGPGANLGMGSRGPAGVFPCAQGREGREGREDQGAREAPLAGRCESSEPNPSEAGGSSWALGTRSH